jgi:gluconolactonase
MKELPYSGVFRVSPDGKTVQQLTTELTGPNGLAFSPDEKYFYVDNWDDKKKVIIMRYEVKPHGTLSNGEVFFDMTSAPGEDALDGLKVDQRGNLYVSGPGVNIRTILHGATMTARL